MQLAPFMSFITDGLSPVLTIQRVLNRLNQPVGQKLVVHGIGSRASDVLWTDRYFEFARLNPELNCLHVVFFGLGISLTGVGEDEPMTEQNMRPSCATNVSFHSQPYHEDALKLETPSVIFCSQAGMNIPSRMRKWLAVARALSLLYCSRTPKCSSHYNRFYAW